MAKGTGEESSLALVGLQPQNVSQLLVNEVIGEVRTRSRNSIYFVLLGVLSNETGVSSETSLVA